MQGISCDLWINQTEQAVDFCLGKKIKISQFRADSVDLLVEVVESEPTSPGYMMRHFRNEIGKNERDSRLLKTGYRSCYLLAIVAVLTLELVFPPALKAAEPYLEFVQGLRDRQYFDSAMSYLEVIEARDNVPKEIKDVISFEKAVTLLDSSRFSQNPDVQAEKLDKAQAYLEQFIKDSPNHSLLATANTELARILLGKAQVTIWKSRSPANDENRLSFQQAARKQIAQAKVIFQKAHDAYKKEWESYGVFIPEDEKEKRAARKRVEGLYMRAQLDLATSSYEEAQSYDQGSKEFISRLRAASIEFEEVHTKYRSQYAGLYARIMQGKCFEEQDDIRKALGIYDELLGHPGKSAGLKNLQNQVLHFRLICLNHKTRKDYRLVIQEAGDWLRFNKSTSRSQLGLGIRWELAQSQESLASDRTTPESERLRLLRQALENARQINKYAGPYKDVSYSLIQKLLVALDREPGDPKDFDSAFGTANSLLEQIGPLREKLKKEKAAGDQKKIQAAEEELQAQLGETQRLYRLALALVNEKTEATQVNSARYKLAYIFYLQRKSYDSAVVGKYLAIRLRKEDPTIALDAAYLAMAGFSQAYNDASEQHKDKNLQLIVDVSLFIATNWPNSDRATDARIEIGRIYRRSDRPLEAAKWYAEVPTTASQYSTAQLEAGQAFWTAYLTTAFQESSPATPEQLKQWQNQAVKHLETGITLKEKTVPASSPSPADLIRAKVSLAQIEIMRGNDAKAIERLTKDPHSVTKAVAVAKGKKRPKEDFKVQSTAFASLAYQYLLRAYIGTQQLDKAEQARAALESIAGSSGGSALTAVYIELGRELQNELERLRKAGDQERLNKVRGGFEKFLSKLLERKQGQTYGSLIWIAETYFGMAQGTKESSEKAKQYYSDATRAFEEILNRGEKDSKFVDPSRLDGVRLRLVNCKRQERDFETAESLIKDVLKKNSKALDAQIEAAQVYQDWGEFGGEPEHFLDAVRGKTSEDGAVIWGWGNIAKRLQMSLNAGQTKAEYKEKLRQAQYHLAQSRYLYAKNSQDSKQSQEQLERAKLEIITFTSLTPGLTETPWWDKFDALYQDILGQLGEVAVSLTKPEPIASGASRSKTISMYDAGTAPEASGEKESTGQKKTKKQKPADSNMPYIFMAVLLLVGLGVVGMMTRSSKRNKGKRSTAEMIAAIPKASANPASSKRTSARKKVKPVSQDPKSSENRASRSSRPEQKPKDQKPSEGTPKRRVRKRPPEEEK